MMVDLFRIPDEDSALLNKDDPERSPVDSSPWRPGGVWENEPVDTSNMNRSGLDPDIAKWTDISNKPLQFNPPLHPKSRPYRVDFGSNSQSDMYGVGEDDYLKERAPTKDLPRFGKEARLGRIVQSDNALGGGNKGDYRWGFRFMYNPTTIQTSAGMNMQVQLDPASPASLYLTAVYAGNLQAHTIPLVINRMADLEDPTLNGRTYAPWPNAATGEAIKKIKDWGTMYDLEYLFRVCNGAWDVEDLGLSGNIGILQPNPAHLILGPGINHYGFVFSVNYQHTRFTLDMVPTLTEVTIQFSRIININQNDVEEYRAKTGYYGGDFDYDRDDADSGSDSSGGGSSTAPPTGDAPTPSGNRVWADPSIPHGGHAGGKVTNSTNYMWQSVWAQFGSGFTGSHCWRANGYGSNTHPGGHACDFMVSQGAAQGAAKAHGDAVVAWATANAEALGICYIIWYKKIWNVNRKSEGWRPYSGANGDPNTDHTNHIHITTVTDPRC